jgi:hypothetical protein
MLAPHGTVPVPLSRLAPLPDFRLNSSPEPPVPEAESGCPSAPSPPFARSPVPQPGGCLLKHGTVSVMSWERLHAGMPLLRRDDGHNPFHPYDEEPLQMVELVRSRSASGTWPVDHAEPRRPRRWGRLATWPASSRPPEAPTAVAVEISCPISRARKPPFEPCSLLPPTSSRRSPDGPRWYRQSAAWRRYDRSLGSSLVQGTTAIPRCVLKSAALRVGFGETWRRSRRCSATRPRARQVLHHRPVPSAAGGTMEPWSLSLWSGTPPSAGRGEARPQGTSLPPDEVELPGGHLGPKSEELVVRS